LVLQVLHPLGERLDGSGKIGMAPLSADCQTIV
jgi:hypothetical protein